MHRQAPLLPLLAEAADLLPQIEAPDVLIIDLSSADNYHRGHIPGAIHLDPQRLLANTPPIPNRLPSVAQLTELFSSIGLSEKTQVVVYDDQMGPWAGRLIWTLDIIGHQRSSFLNGHLQAWIAAGGALETSANQPLRQSVAVTINRDLIAELEDIQATLGNPDRVIWDARSAEEYRGEKKINAVKAGHIPGARHLEWTQALVSNDDWRLKDADTLNCLLAAQGIDRNKEVITHCQTHRRSGLTYLVAKVLGYPRIRCYDGSWFEWGNHPTTPVATGHEPTTAD